MLVISKTKKVTAFTGKALIKPGVNPLTTSLGDNYFGINNNEVYFGDTKLSLWILLLTLSNVKPPIHPAAPPKAPHIINHILLGVS